MYIALLGRQPELSIAELERLFTTVSWFSPQTALIETTETIDIRHIGGSQKMGKVVFRIDSTQWDTLSTQIISHYSETLASSESKVTFGISAYGFDKTSRDVQKIGLAIKSQLKRRGVSMRLVPNEDVSLSTATSHHNKLGLSANKIELLVVRGEHSTIIAESIGTQNISALAARDQGRPRRDAFVGMLPPKLAQIMVNIALGSHHTKSMRVLDPFCGTGVVLQEALLLGHDVYGTDLSEKMVSYSIDNLRWLMETFLHSHENDETQLSKWTVHEGDAMKTQWQPPIEAVVSETYLGQPFSAPPSLKKLTEVRNNCNHIISEFLVNLSNQLEPGIPVVLAIPAWKNADNSITHLPLTQSLDTLGFRPMHLSTVDATRLMYARPNQVVARELLLLIKK